jgi:hypothetical protein
MTTTSIESSNDDEFSETFIDDAEKRALSNPKHTFHIKCEKTNDEYTLVGRPCELSAFSFVPQNRIQIPTERTIYNSKKPESTLNPTDYDKLFNVDLSFNKKVHRCDRKHAKLLGLDRWSEEVPKSVPTLSSTIYGQKLLSIQAANTTTTTTTTKPPLQVKYSKGLEDSDRKYARIAKVKSEFYNRNGINDLKIKQESI